MSCQAKETKGWGAFMIVGTEEKRKRRLSTEKPFINGLFIVPRNVYTHACIGCYRRISRPNCNFRRKERMKWEPSKIHLTKKRTTTFFGKLWPFFHLYKAINSGESVGTIAICDNSTNHVSAYFLSRMSSDM